MINVTLGEVKTQEEKPFPKLMINSDRRIVVLMSESCVGTVVYSKIETYQIGHYSEGWGMHNFTDYNEPITLQNA